MVAWSAKRKDIKQSVFAVPDLDEAVNPFQPLKIQSRFPGEFALILPEKEKFVQGVS